MLLYAGMPGAIEGRPLPTCTDAAHVSEDAWEDRPRIGHDDSGSVAFKCNSAR